MNTIYITLLGSFFHEFVLKYHNIQCKLFMNIIIFLKTNFYYFCKLNKYANKFRKALDNL